MSALLSAFLICLAPITHAAADAPSAQDAPKAEQSGQEPPPTAVQPPQPPPPLPALNVRREQQQSALLKKWYGEQTLNLSTQEGEFVAIWQEDTSGKPLGALLMLHDASQMPDWPAQLQPLRHYLSQHGWATLSISLPEQDLRVLPARPEAPRLPPPAAPPGDGQKPTDEMNKDAGQTPVVEPAAQQPAPPPGEETRPESQVVYNDATGKLGDGTLPAAQRPVQEVLPSPPAEPVAQQRISAALALLKDKKQFNNSLLGVGLGAARAAYFVVQQQGEPTQAAPDGTPITPPFQTLLLINPRMHIEALTGFNLNQALSNPMLPVLDISYRTHPAAPNSASLRKMTARKNKLKAFEQHIILEPEGSDAGEGQLNRIVRGFLVKYAKGKEIKITPPSDI
jgi:hypothetical protein